MRKFATTGEEAGGLLARTVVGTLTSKAGVLDCAVGGVTRDSDCTLVGECVGGNAGGDLRATSAATPIATKAAAKITNQRERMKARCDCSAGKATAINESGTGGV